VDLRPVKFLIVFLAVFIWGLVMSPAPAFAKNDVVPGEYIIKYKPGVDAQTKSKLINKHALEHRKSFKIIDAQVVKLPARMQAQSESSLLEELASDPAIEYIEPNYRLYPMGTPISGDAGAANLWGLKNYGQSILGVPGVAGIDINLETAWLVTQGDPEVLVAVIDTGVDISHPDLKDAIWTNPGEIPDNGIDDDNNGFIDDVNGWDFRNKDKSVFDFATTDKHGTHCAGTIAAARNEDGVVGVAPGVKILPLKFMDTSGGSTDAAIEAIGYAKAAGAKIVNCSWGGSDGSVALREAIANSGMLFVAAAGNAEDGKTRVNIDITPLYPASFDLDNIITVAAIDNKGALAQFSYYGPQSVDVAAPGNNIYSTVPDNNYDYLKGTSMAAAHVSGIAALVASAGYTDNAIIKQRILDSASLHPLANLSDKVLTGGLVDAAAAAEIEMAPLASDLSISGTLYQGETLQAAYTYFDLNRDVEADSQLQWYRADAADKSNGEAIAEANDAQYMLTGEDIGKYIYFSVTPAAAAGNSPGTTVYSNCVGPAEAGPLTGLQILNGTENLLSGFSTGQTSYALVVDSTLTNLQILYTAVDGSTVIVSFNDVTLTGDQITLDGQGGTVTVLVQTPGIADRTYTITISQGDNCFIATAAFGSKFAPAVKLLRSFRDEYLLTNKFGKAFVAFYYRHSPPLAHYIADRDGLRTLTRVLLSPFIAAVYLLYHKWLAVAVLMLAGLVIFVVRVGRWRRANANS